MKKQGILNREIASVLARLGHTDTIVIADCGLPIPDDTPCIDVSIEKGMPRFADVLEAILEDMEVEQYTLAEEMKENNPELLSKVQDLVQSEADFVSHEKFKAQSSQAKAIIRTGEATPYANIILHSGVIF
ncbi:D-ribose pyranase [Halobacillus yeomjeoni]|uniref:D-ribose pyranase n=1 Tax=Halobacillus yeomjeoni TaxID=311194 RepID=A0A931HXQ8_9BACI|nr:D-ribose pyranase [Halobacillus yeomjeoni]MBH0231340.1 D-ribose pyranase [Halobacillus yeomjeoni]